MTASVEEWKRRYETARLAHEEARAEKNALQTEIDRLRAERFGTATHQAINPDAEADQAMTDPELVPWLRREGYTQSADEVEQLILSKAALQVEIERLRMLNDELHKLLDGVERRQCEYLALIEKHATEVERLKAERHTTKQMLEDVLYKHDQHYGLGRGGLKVVKDD